MITAMFRHASIVLLLCMGAGYSTQTFCDDGAWKYHVVLLKGITTNVSVSGEGVDVTQEAK